MTCRSLQVPGGTAIVCSRGAPQPKPCSVCRGPGGRLCDGRPPERKGKTCDSPLCVGCAVQVDAQLSLEAGKPAEPRDLCPACAARERPAEHACVICRAAREKGTRLCTADQAAWKLSPEAVSLATGSPSAGQVAAAKDSFLRRRRAELAFTAKPLPAACTHPEGRRWFYLSGASGSLNGRPFGVVERCQNCGWNPRGDGFYVTRPELLALGLELSILTPDPWEKPRPGAAETTRHHSKAEGR